MQKYLVEHDIERVLKVIIYSSRQLFF